jgi:putative hydrolase of the HAD superfamily
LAWREELPVWRGKGDYFAEISELLAAYGVDTPASDIHEAAWLAIDVIDETAILARQLGGTGYGVHLATNQDPGRARFMRTELAYDELFDVGCYSCDLGIAKPDPRFFVQVARIVGSRPGFLVPIDDIPANIASPRSVGYTGIGWHFHEGHQKLRGALRAIGVPAL